MSQVGVTINGPELRLEAARCRRLAEGVSGQADRDLILRFADEKERAAEAWDLRRI